MTILRTGVDLVEINRMVELNKKIRKRFLERVFNDEEREEAGEDNSMFAARFAAKEAVVKALGCGIGPVSWKEINLKYDENGAIDLELSGNAESLAAELGLTNWSVSTSVTVAYAVALVVAYGEEKK